MSVNNQMNSKVGNGYKVMDMVADKLKTLGKDIDAAIEESICLRKAALSWAEHHEQRKEVSENLIKIEGERQLLTQYDVLEDKTVEPLAQLLKQQMNVLGCTVQQNRSKYDGSLYRFDFGNERSITVCLNGSHLKLVQMCPVNANFNSIKEFLEESQDLLGLLVCYGNMLRKS